MIYQFTVCPLDEIKKKIKKKKKKKERKNKTWTVDWRKHKTKGIDSVISAFVEDIK